MVSGTNKHFIYVGPLPGIEVSSFSYGYRKWMFVNFFIGFIGSLDCKFWMAIFFPQQRSDK